MPDPSTQKASVGRKSEDQLISMPSDSNVSKVYTIVPRVEQGGKSDKEIWFEYNYKLQLESLVANTSSRHSSMIVSQGKDTIYGADESTLEGRLNTATNELDIRYSVQRNYDSAITYAIKVYEGVAASWMKNHPEEIVTVDKRRRR